MPELPEVETIKEGLRPYLLGARVNTLRSSGLPLREPIPLAALRKALHSKTIIDVWRRSKYIGVVTANDTVLIHLGMTGNLLIRKDASDQFPHTHLVVRLERSDFGVLYLHYVDPRRFGRINVIPNQEVDQHPLLCSLGPEPLESRQLGDYLWKTAHQVRRPIKTFIMDSHVVVGVGNIYASESLFKARIDPTRLAADVTKDEFLCLGREIKSTLRRAIKAGGTSFRDFRDQDGKPGYFAISLNVYGRKDQPCPSCKRPIICIKQTGRSTFYCSHCQH